MKKYKVDIVKYSECIVDTLEDVYDNYEDAVEAGQEWFSGYSVATTIMRLAGEEFDDSHSLKYKVHEINKPLTGKIIPLCLIVNNTYFNNKWRYRL